MTNWCLKNLSDEYDMIVVFANTGDEKEASLVFADRCDKHFGWNLIWLECITKPNFGEGVSYKIVDFNSASRNGEPFESMIAKHGIPNQNFPHCFRELKGYTIKAYLRDIEWGDCYTAIGIRSDEAWRVNWQTAAGNRLIYPLITSVRITKPQVNVFWNKMPFRLELESWQGNCKACWKKSKRKLMTIAVTNPQDFSFTRRMEEKYGYYQPGHREKDIELPLRFFRERQSVDDIFEDAKFPFRLATDDKINYAVQTDLWEDELDSNFGCTESCEAFG